MPISPSERTSVGRITAAARSLRAICFSAFVVALASPAYAAEAASVIGNPPRPPVTANVAKPPSKPGTKPLWVELTPAQQQALAPLAVEWDKVDPLRKRKWLEIGNKFASMKPDEQQRIQQRMREWIKLTPEQRRVARESFARSKRLDAAQKSARWRQYQQLPEEQKKKLAADHAAKKRVANLPTAHGGNKTVPPIRSTPKPILEHSVTPHAAKPPSPPQPATQPASSLPSPK